MKLIIKLSSRNRLLWTAFLCFALSFTAQLPAQAQPVPAFVIQGPTITQNDGCEPSIHKDNSIAGSCANISYPSSSQILQQGYILAPRGNLVFQFPVVSTVQSKLAYGVGFQVTVNVAGPQTSTTQTNKLTLYRPGSATLQVPINVDWAESVVSFQIRLNQTYSCWLEGCSTSGGGGGGTGGGGTGGGGNHHPNLTMTDVCPPGPVCIDVAGIFTGPDLSSVQKQLPLAPALPLTSDGFPIYVTPAAAFQLPFLPIAIVYGPLGNGSKAQSTLTLIDIASSSMQFTNTDDTTQGVTNDNKTNWQVGLSADLSASPLNNIPSNDGAVVCPADQKSKNKKTCKLDVSIGATYGQNWDTTHESDNESIYGTGTLLSESEEQDLTLTINPPNNEPSLGQVGYLNQPYWQDTFVIISDPQFAVWNYPQGAVLQPLGSNSVTEVQVSQLHGCKFSPNPPAMTPVFPGAWKAYTKYAVNSLIVDSNGEIQWATRAGTSSVKPPQTWNTNGGENTFDGTVVWTNMDSQFVSLLGQSAPGAYTWRHPWTASHFYAAGDTVYGYPTIQVVTSAGTSGTVYPPNWNTTNGGTTKDGTVTWKDEVLAAWTPNHYYDVGNVVLDSNLDYQVVTTAGYSGAAAPNFTQTTTVDAAVVWTNEGTGQAWQASHAFALGTVINASNFSIQVASVGGLSNATPPNWNMVPGGTSSDGGVTWVNVTDHVLTYAGPTRTEYQLLSSDECSELLSLDQFYVSGTQSAHPPTAYQVSANWSPNLIFGDGITFTNKETSSTTASATNTVKITSKVTSVSGSSLGFSGGINVDLPILPGIIDLKLGANGSFNQSNTQTITFSSATSNALQSQRGFSSQTAVSTTVQEALTAGKEAPPSIKIWQDSVFLGMAVQDLDMKPPIPTDQVRLTPPLSPSKPRGGFSGVPVVPVGESASLFRRKSKGAASAYVKQLPYGSVVVSKPAKKTEPFAQ
jgi:hypothetical protein